MKKDNPSCEPSRGSVLGRQDLLHHMYMGFFTRKVVAGYGDRRGRGSSTTTSTTSSRRGTGLLCMWMMQVLLLLAFLAIMSGVGTTQAQVFTPTDDILLSCGSSANVTVDDGRVFVPDNSSSSNTLLTAPQGTTVVGSTVQNNANLDYPNLVSSARFFTEKSSYTFKVSSGRHWVRLYFYPFPSGNFTPNASFFSLSANQFTLLNNFSCVAFSSFDKPLVFREYLINVTSPTLVLSFSPQPNSYAFINALEVVSMPSNLLTDDATLVGQQAPQTLGLPGIALQTMYRINVGGASVSPQNDSQGLYRSWVPDSNYIFAAATGAAGSVQFSLIKYGNDPTYIAPPAVYATARTLGGSQTVTLSYNVSWVFPVDLGYTYFVRLHFCEIIDSAINQRVFNVYINNQTVLSNFDVIAVVGNPDVVLYEDFAAPMFTGPDANLWVQMGPAPSATVKDAILNGLEIFKMNNSAGGLSGPNPSVTPSSPSTVVAPTGGGSKQNLGVIIGVVVGGVAAVVVLAAFIYYCCSRKPKLAKKPTPPMWLPLPLHGSSSDTSRGMTHSHKSGKSGAGSYVSSVPSNMGRFFTFAELQEATNNFDESLLLGVGGFGKVYKGEIDDGSKVAVKRGNPQSEQGLAEFQTEIEMLSKLRHRHLVSLIGYCDDSKEMILVYDYMSKGPLRSHLYGTKLPNLSWKQRLEICIGAARGLHYLHTGAAQSIIHRDVKTTNILLDENFVAKVADFGLSKTGPSLEQTHVSTAVKGSFGYLDPEYFRRQQLTEKSDVYSFGVVLMEVLCARPAINPALPREQVNMAEWALKWQKMGMLDQIKDTRLAGACNPESLRKFGDIAEKCLAEQGIDRPSMGDVLWNLEYALQLQESSSENFAGTSEGTSALLDNASMDNSFSANDSLSQPAYPQPRANQSVEPSLTFSTEHSLGVSEGTASEDASAGDIFSQLVHPEGR